MHDWKEHKNKIICSLCGASRLKLKESNFEGLKTGIRSNGKVYSVRDDRKRFFFPDEWIKFYDSLKDNNKPIFDALINTGGRIDELLHVKAGDFSDTRNALILKVTKVKAKKKERLGKWRTIAISSQFSRRMKKLIEKNKISSDQVIFNQTKQAVWKLMRTKLKKAEIKDWYNFSLHNIRKSHGNWLKALGIRADEICSRLGHDMDTYLEHYGSPNIFNRKDKILMIKILGDVYDLK